MTEGRRRELWDHTANLAASFANVFQGRDDPPVDPRDLHPFPDERQTDALSESPGIDEAANKANWKALKGLFKAGAFSG